MPIPDLTRVPSFYHNYIRQVKDDDLLTALKNNTEVMLAFFRSIPEERHDYRYAEGKWSIKELVQHLTDSERVFTYRALRFARKDKTPLSGFDENLFTENSHASERSWSGLISEFETVRTATLHLFGSFSEEQLEASGEANGDSVYVLGIGFICAGHCYHHRNIIIERYL